MPDPASQKAGEETSEAKHPSGPTFVPLEYLANKATFGHSPGPEGTVWAWPINGTPHNLRRAVMQHLVIASANQALDSQDRSRAEFVRLADLKENRVGERFRGERGANPLELAAISAIAPDAFPSPASLYTEMLLATVCLEAEVSGAGGRVGGFSRDNRAHVDGARRTLQARQAEAERAELEAARAINALTGNRRLRETAADRSNAARLTEAAGSLLRADAHRLATGEALTGASIEGEDSVLLYPTNEYAPVQVIGDVDDGLHLVGHLKPTWDADVLDRGYAMLDGRFVLDIADMDDQGRPTVVLVLHLAAAQEGRAPEDVDWRFTTIPASVDWSGASPRLPLANSSVRRND